MICFTTHSLVAVGIRLKPLKKAVYTSQSLQKGLNLLEYTFFKNSLLIETIWDKKLRQSGTSVIYQTKMRQSETIWDIQNKLCLKVFLANSIVSEIFKEYACLRVCRKSVCLTFFQEIYMSQHFPRNLPVSRLSNRICLSHYFQGNLFVSLFIKESICLNISKWIYLSQVFLTQSVCLITC